MPPVPRTKAHHQSSSSRTRLLLWPLLIAVLLYTGFQTRNLIRGPQITITSPASGSKLAQASVDITGQAQLISRLSLNDNPIFTDQEGNFSQKLLLAPGYNIIKVEAQDRFNRTISKTIQLIYQQDGQKTARRES